MNPGESPGVGPAGTLLVCAGAAAVALALAAGLGFAIQRRAARGSHEQPPYRIPTAIAAESADLRTKHGRVLYMKSCAHCHGLDATGDEGPDLHGIWISDRGIATVIRRGIKGEMPSFARKHNDAETAELVAFVRSMQ